MQTQIKAVCSDHSKGKSVGKVSAAIDELEYLIDFNASISQAMAKTMEHLSDFVFVSMANFTLKDIGKEINLNIFESIQGVVMNAQKTPPSRQCYMQYTAFYLHSDKQFLSPHTTGKEGEMRSLLTASHTLAVKRYTF